MLRQYRDDPAHPFSGAGQPRTEQAEIAQYGQYCDQTVNNAIIFLAMLHPFLGAPASRLPLTQFSLGCRPIGAAVINEIKYQ